MTMDDSGQKKQVVIEKEKATFWMDGAGRWHNQHGPFRHKKIIDYFNTSIGKDDKGYFVVQELGHITEKVYFPYEATALFVVDIVWEDKVRLVLNTKADLELAPANLFVNEDSLYYRLGDEIAKFSERALLAISKNITCNGNRYAIRIGSASVELPELGETGE